MILPSTVLDETRKRTGLSGLDAKVYFLFCDHTNEKDVINTASVGTKITALTSNIPLNYFKHVFTQKGLIKKDGPLYRLQGYNPLNDTALFAKMRPQNSTVYTAVLDVSTLNNMNYVVNLSRLRSAGYVFKDRLYHSMIEN